MQVRHATDPSLDALREKVLATALLTTAVGAPLVSLLILAQAIAEQKTTPLLLALCAYPFTYPLLRVMARWLGPRWTGFAYLALMLLMTLLIQLRGGVSAGVLAIQLLIVLLAGVLYGGRGVLVALGITLSGFAFAGVLVLHGAVPPIDASMWDPLRSSVWIRAALVMAFFGGAAGLAVTYTVKRLAEEGQRAREALDREKQQRLAIERAESEKDEARRALAEAERVTALGRLASGVAHDYNNVLTVIMGAAELAQLGDDLPEEARVCLQDITQAARQAAELTRSLLALGRRDVSQPKRLDVKALLGGLRGTLRRVLPSDIELSIEPHESAEVFIDPTQLERVLLNLILNARDAIEGKGSIEVGYRLEHVDDERPDLPPGNYVVVWVRDDGHGMDPEVRRRLFEPFFTTKKSGRGTGIGMALVHGFVTEAAGTVVVDSAPGNGTTISLYLPEAREEDISQLQSDRAVLTAGPTDADRSILLVEDNPAVLASTTRILEHAGFSVIQANDGDAALRVVGDAAQRVDLLCIDGVIPGTSTAKVIEQCREQRTQIPVIVCSGYVDEELLRRGIQTGAYACVRKPFTAAQLVECVRAELGMP